MYLFVRYSKSLTHRIEAWQAHRVTLETDLEHAIEIAGRLAAKVENELTALRELRKDVAR